MMAADFVLLPGLVLPEPLAIRLAEVCLHSERTREAVVRDAIADYCEDYLDGLEGVD
jgi:hypothetical protein